MIIEFMSDLGVWSWFLIGLLLLIGEVVLPGIFLIWFGAAALAVGTLTLLPFTDVSWWPWQAQLAAFGVLSIVFVLLGIRLFPSTGSGAADGMNTPLRRWHGQTGVLEEAIANGSGRVRLGDTIWRVKGSDAPAGSRVTVKGDDGSVLLVEPQE